ncbi:MAG TPA: nicotinate phosphoribosyltransferase [Acidimicrobiales bacterium]|nr:nicotinate phosphoribosyltransferase [Acidimicrobiales bacterium]
MGDALVTDLYELTMAASFLRRGMATTATFSLFVRSLPADRGFLVAAGLERCLDYLASFAFTGDDLAALAGAGLAAGDLDALAGLRFTGDVHAVEEGRVVLAGEPLLEVTAPLPQAQVVETYLLNQVTYQTALATKAARCRLAAGGMALFDFALRRTHGVEAGMAAARAAAIAGFDATSNVAAAHRYRLAASGTMAHSYVEAFPTEADAFRAYATDFPDRCTFLVDTYDTLRGVDTAVAVIGELGMAGRPNLAVRIDSGDLAALARAARRRLDRAGLPQVAIVVSGGLDEHDLARFRAAGDPVDVVGVGTKVGVSADAPSLESAYKAVAIGGRPVAKQSAGKATLPGAKQVWRTDRIDRDVLALRDECGPAGYRPLLRPVMRGGRRTADRPADADAVALARDRLRADLAALPDAAARTDRPVAPVVTVSASLSALAAGVAGRS